MDELKSAYLQLLATLYWDVERWLDEFGATPVHEQKRCEQMWSRFAALRDRFATLKREVSLRLTARGRSGVHEMAIRAFLYELERMLDVEPEGVDWESLVGATVIEVEGRICDEARQVERWG